MTEETISRLRAAVESGVVRWMAGMRWTGSTGQFRHNPVNRYWYPDLTDPATIGCLLAQVRERYGDPHAHAYADPLTWFQQPGGSIPWAIRTTKATVGRGPTELLALLDALERAPS